MQREDERCFTQFLRPPTGREREREISHVCESFKETRCNLSPSGKDIVKIKKRGARFLWGTNENSGNGH